MKTGLQLLFALLIPGAAAIAQSTYHYSVFPTIDHSGSISRKLDYSLYYFGGINLISKELQGTDVSPDFSVFYSEQALTYHVNKLIALTGAYVYERQNPLESNYRSENRFYVQGTYKYNLNRTTLKHRLRYDGRYIQDRITGESPYTSRVRYLFGITTPLNKTDDNLYFSAYNEFFFNTFKSAPVIYGENWAYAGLGLKTSKSSAFEVGPLYIFWVNKQTDLTNFLYLQLTWVSHLDFTRKQKEDPSFNKVDPR